MERRPQGPGSSASSAPDGDACGQDIGADLPTPCPSIEQMKTFDIENKAVGPIKNFNRANVHFLKGQSPPTSAPSSDLWCPSTDSTAPSDLVAGICSLPVATGDARSPDVVG